MRHLLSLATITILGVSGCGAPSGMSKPRDQMSQREKDSILAASRLPGSGVVKKAIAVSDAQKRRAAAYDSAGDQN
ncbi:MAG TPA: hypothetical protein VIF83_01515 [Gemmatimonadaceae bacterium]|jgi:hypothetical protein